MIAVDTTSKRDDYVAKGGRKYYGHVLFPERGPKVNLKTLRQQKI